MADEYAKRRATMTVRDWPIRSVVLIGISVACLAIFVICFAWLADDYRRHFAGGRPAEHEFVRVYVSAVFYGVPVVGAAAAVFEIICGPRGAFPGWRVLAMLNLATLFFVALLSAGVVGF